MRSEIIRTTRRALDRFRAYRYAADNLQRGCPENPVGTVAINAYPLFSSWGGGNQWLLQMVRHLTYAGYRVVFDLQRPDIDCILVLHSSTSQHGSFNLGEISAYRARHPKVKVIHRINENDARKNTNFMDAEIARMNEVADFTVFISAWLLEHHAAKWFDRRRPHKVIWNGADSRYFHPVGGRVWNRQEPFVLVTHHWSDHWNKGFGAYQQIDSAIAEGRLLNTELWVIGRWPRELNWKSARTFSPCQGEALATLLRRAHGYVTASLAEPGGMHFIEGLQCGLPLAYHEDGGGIVEVGQHIGGVPFKDDPLSAVLKLQQNYAEIAETVSMKSPSGESMTLSYLECVRRMARLARNS